jgi:hypothetical protein
VPYTTVGLSKYILSRGCSSHWVVSDASYAPHARSTLQEAVPVAAAASEMMFPAKRA